MAHHWDTLSTYFLSTTPKLRCSAAVGGAVPMMELVQCLVRGGETIREIRGDGLASTLVGFMGTRRLSLSRLTVAAQYSCFPPTIVQRRIEAIPRKRACRGSVLFLSSERGWIG